MMMKLSSRGVLLVLSLLMAGSSWPGSIAPQAAMAEARSRRESVRGISPARSSPTLSAIKIAHGQPSPATDVGLTVILGGGLIALLLRRTQRSVGMGRLAA